MSIPASPLQNTKDTPQKLSPKPNKILPVHIISTLDVQTSDLSNSINDTIYLTLALEQSHDIKHYQQKDLDPHIILTDISNNPTDNSAVGVPADFIFSSNPSGPSVYIFSPLLKMTQH